MKKNLNSLYRFEYRPDNAKDGYTDDGYVETQWTPIENSELYEILTIAYNADPTNKNLLWIRDNAISDPQPYRFMFHVNGQYYRRVKIPSQYWCEVVASIYQ